jgi:hypothetical protein
MRACSVPSRPKVMAPKMTLTADFSVLAMVDDSIEDY